MPAHLHCYFVRTCGIHMPASICPRLPSLLATEPTLSPALRLSCRPSLTPATSTPTCARKPLTKLLVPLHIPMMCVCTRPRSPPLPFTHPRCAVVCRDHFSFFTTDYVDEHWTRNFPAIKPHRRLPFKYRDFSQCCRGVSTKLILPPTDLAKHTRPARQFSSGWYPLYFRSTFERVYLAVILVYVALRIL